MPTIGWSPEPSRDFPLSKGVPSQGRNRTDHSRPGRTFALHRFAFSQMRRSNESTPALPLRLCASTALSVRGAPRTLDALQPPVLMSNTSHCADEGREVDAHAVPRDAQYRAEIAPHVPNSFVARRRSTSIRLVVSADQVRRREARRARVLPICWSSSCWYSAAIASTSSSFREVVASNECSARSSIEGAGFAHRSSSSSINLAASARRSAKSLRSCFTARTHSAPQPAHGPVGNGLPGWLI